MNGNAHKLIGTISAVGFYAGACKKLEIPVTKTGLSKAGVMGFIGGIIPDILEPADNPHHRSVFHSISAAGTISYGIYRMYQYMETYRKEPDWLFLLSIGYMSHLGADLTTPFGLPVIY